MAATLPPEPDRILLAFERNSRVNAALLAAMGDSDLQFSAGGGWSIGKHLCHLAHFRLRWLRVVAPSFADGLAALVELTDDDFEPLATEVGEISDAFRVADAAALDAVSLALAEGRPFEAAYRSHPTGLLMHILVHDAHHRGQVMSLLRQNGRQRSEMERLEDASWPVWRE